MSSNYLMPNGTVEGSTIRFKVEVLVKMSTIFMVNSVIKELGGRPPKLFKLSVASMDVSGRGKIKIHNLMIAESTRFDLLQYHVSFWKMYILIHCKFYRD